jgi:uncharacterized protein YciI
MTEAEREIMGRHFAYWTDQMNWGHVLVFGPVMAPDGFYGLGIVEADSEELIRGIIQEDPAIQAGLLNTVERMVYPEVPPRVEYKLTEYSQTLKSIFEVLNKWGANHLIRQG